MVYKDLSIKIELIKIKDDRRKVFTKEELPRIINSIDNQELKDICLITYLTGSRRCEILNIKYCDIDFVNKLIKIYQEKPLKECGLKEIPLSPNLISILSKYFYSDDNIIKYFSPDQKIFSMSPSNVSHSFKKILRKNNIDDYLHFHSLRHTAATDLLKSGVSLTKAKSILGHSSTKVTENYVHLIAEDLRSDLIKLEMPA